MNHPRPFGAPAANSAKPASHTRSEAVVPHRSAPSTRIAGPARWFGLAVLGSLLAACGAATPGAGGGSVSGTVHLNGSAAQTAPTTAATRAALTPSAPGTSEIIVRVEAGRQAPAHLDLHGRRYARVRALALTGSWLYAAGQASVTSASAGSSDTPGVLSIEPNTRVYPAGTSEPLASEQWGHAAVRAPAAWNSAAAIQVTVAVLDTGILHAGDASPRTHPDLIGRVLPGYDFISNPADAGDGNGRDPDPYDSGPPSGRTPSDHGSHVAGVIAAAHDGQGIGGLDPHARILPVRVLTDEGGSLADLIDGMLWAGGIDVPSVPRNANPARVINLSLSGPGACTGSMQAAIDRLAGKGVITVTAAGNFTGDAAAYLPGNCRGVINVGATGRDGQQAAYSNWGPRIDLMAPGGDIGNLAREGILSLGRSNGTLTHVRKVGTSMAAPHVAAVVSMLKAAHPDLSAADALHVLRATAQPLSAQQCRPGDCGAGLLDAAAVMQAAATRTLVEARSVASGAVFRAELGLVTASRSYRLQNLPPGRYRVVAFVDANGNGSRDPHEDGTEFPDVVEVGPGRVLDGVDLIL